jgi:hypothetical protein
MHDQRHMTTVARGMIPKGIYHHILEVKTVHISAFGLGQSQHELYVVYDDVTQVIHVCCVIHGLCDRKKFRFSCVQFIALQEKLSL